MAETLAWEEILTVKEHSVTGFGTGAVSMIAR